MKKYLCFSGNFQGTRISRHSIHLQVGSLSNLKRESYFANSCSIHEKYRLTNKGTFHPLHRNYFPSYPNPEVQSTQPSTALYTSPLQTQVSQDILTVVLDVSSCYYIHLQCLLLQFFIQSPLNINRIILVKEEMLFNYIILSICRYIKIFAHSRFIKKFRCEHGGLDLQITCKSSLCSLNNISNEINTSEQK